jgi:ATP-binding cassette subfamily B multidrug efflux pump
MWNTGRTESTGHTIQERVAIMSKANTTELRQEAEQQALSLRLIGRLFQTLGGYRWLVVAGCIMVCICAWADMQIIHEATLIIKRESWRHSGLINAFIPLLIVCFINRVFGWLQWVTTIFATNRAVARLRKQFFSKLLMLPKPFFDTHKSGWLTARSTGDIEVLQDFLTYALMMLGVFSTITISAWHRIAQIAPVLLLPAIAMMPTILFMTLFYKRRMSKLQRTAREQNSQLVANMSEAVRGVRVVHAFARQERNLEDFNALNLKSHDTEIRAARLDALFMPSLDFIGVLNTVIVIIFAAWLLEHPDFFLLDKPLTTGDIIAYVLYMNVIIWPTRMLVELYSMSIRAMAAAERIFEIIDFPITIQDPPQPVTISTLKGQIQFEQACFRYKPDTDWILKGFNLSIEPGETVALVGETGAGKTTIASLIARFYDLDSGRITIDQVDVRHYRQSDLHAHMGIVLQQGYLFSGSVMDNLRFRRMEMPEDEVIAHAKKLGTHDAIMALSDGYNTQILEGGESISLGQRQVIAITRALLANPTILILDEPTSALDIHTEGIIQNAIGTLIQDRTTILIAHRLSTVKHADRILAIRAGKIVEAGTHDQLIRQNGYYKTLVNLSDAADGRLN